MAVFINSSKELYFGNRYFKDHVMAPEFDYGTHRNELSPYFARYGFKVSMMYNDYYSRLSGIVSDKYLPMDLYYMYVIPCLNRRDMQKAYADKNIYSSLFSDVLQPETVIKNRNGHFYNHSDSIISRDDAVSICTNANDCIIKPTVETGDGVGVERFDSSSVKNISDQFAQYSSDFIVQKRVRQHERLSELNPSSLNSMRLMTYRSLDGRINFLPGKSFLRFGCKNSCKDNVSAGGGMVQIDQDGLISDRVVRYKTMQVHSLINDYGITPFHVPEFDCAVELVKSLHRRVYYSDLLGWDIAISESGNPVFVEMNVVPACESIQQGCGPLFDGEILEEVVGRITTVKKSTVEVNLRVFKPGFDHLLQIRGAPYFT